MFLNLHFLRNFEIFIKNQDILNKLMPFLDTICLKLVIYIQGEYESGRYTCIRMSKLTREKEQELLSRLPLDDEQAFASLFYSYNNKLYGFVFGITGSSEIAKDIVQDVFLKIWKTRRSAHEVENFNALVYRMARNAALDHLKRASRESTAVSGLRLLSDEHVSNDPFEDMNATDILLKYERALVKLPKQQRIVYELRHLEGQEYIEIAKKLNLSVPTVRSHFRNALNTLKTNMFLILIVLFSRF